MKKLDIRKSALEATYDSKFAFLGSCFSENIHGLLIESGFESQSNPYGTFFSPKAIEQFILNESDVLFNDEAFIKKENIHLNFHANAKVYGTEKYRYKTALQLLRNNFIDYLKNADILFLTLGTAWVYEYKQTRQVVANCHKIEQKAFDKRMLTIEEVVVGQTKLIQYFKQLNKNLKIVYTVSPVRHLKDGFVENNRSKARLFEAISILEDKYEVGYFEAFEIINDVLRDYQFFEDDGVHPNNKGVKAVIAQFFETFLSEKTIKTQQQYLKLKRQIHHIPIHPELQSALIQKEKLKAAFQEFMNDNNIKPL